MHRGSLPVAKKQQAVQHRGIARIEVVHSVNRAVHLRVIYDGLGGPSAGSAG